MSNVFQANQPLNIGEQLLSSNGLVRLILQDGGKRLRSYLAKRSRTASVKRAKIILCEPDSLKGMPAFTPQRPADTLKYE
jgi:hypothetical protein